MLLAGAIVSLIIGLLLIGFGSAFLGREDEGGITCVASGLFCIFLSIALFQPAFSKMEDEKILKDLSYKNILDRKVDVHLEDYYVPHDSTSTSAPIVNKVINSIKRDK